MLIANPRVANSEKVCYRHLLSLNGILHSQETMVHSYECSGFDRYLHSPTRSTSPCLNFISVADINKGLCAYEHKARNGFEETPVRTEGHHCNGCNSNHDSGKDTNEHSACTAYTPMLKVTLGSCAWRVRSQRLLDIYGGDKLQLKPEEKHCLDECDASKKSPCRGYIDVKHVVEQTCLHKVNLDSKLRAGGAVEGLEELCAGCKGQCSSRRCQDSYTSVTEVHHFEVWNNLHPLSAKKTVAGTNAA